MVVKNRQNKNEIVLTAKDKDFLRGYSVNGLTITQKKFLCVFYVRLCNVSQSCRALGISRQTFYRWCKGYKSDSFSMAVKEVEERTAHIKEPLDISVMGCAVNALGEAKHADVAIAYGKGEGLVIVKGEIVAKLKEGELKERFLEEVEKAAKERAKD